MVLLFIPLAKWYKKQRFKAQPRTLFNNFLEILWKLQIIWMVTLSEQLIFLLNQSHSKADVSWFQKLGAGGAGSFILW